MKKYLVSICLIMFAASLLAQTRVVTGQVVGSQKDTLIGVVVMQKGTSNATFTDEEGKFSLQVTDTVNVILVVSYVGYKGKEISIGNQSQVNIVMEADDAMDEVVVVGYGTVKKSDLTGSVVSLKPDDVKQVPSGNVLDAIQGKAPGVDIVTTSGETGKAPNVTIRGNRSITAGNGPLYVVDGVQYSSIQDINPNDILSMEVLKDASSTAIYGSRGANGVIIVTTKKGVSGTPRISLNSYVGISSVLAYPRAMSGNQYADFKLEVYKTQNPADATPTYQEALSAEEYTNYTNGVMTNYTDELLHNGVQKDIQLSISGGTDKMKTYFSLDYFNQKGLLKKDELKRYTGRLNVDYQVFKFLKVGTQLQMTFYDQSKRANPLGNAAKINPLTTPFNPDGSIILVPGGKHANPLLDEQPNKATDQLNTTRIFPTIYAEALLFKNLTARTNLAINWDGRKEGIFYAADSYSRINDGYTTSLASYQTDQRLQLNWQGILNYNKKFGKNHSLGVTGLSEMISNKTEVFYLESIDQLIPEQSYYNLADHASSLMGSNYIKSVLVSFAGRVNYSFKDKYLFSFTGRSDGASVLADGHKWDFFPSAAVGWKLNEEKFMESFKAFNLIKLRGSWGVTGNSNIAAYSTQSTLQKVPMNFDEDGVTAYTFKPQIGNTGTKWEKSNTWDVGLDLGILTNRIVFTFDYYSTHTKDLLLTKKLPLSTGVTQTVSNVGKTSNKGIEIAATTHNVNKKNFSWTTTLSFMSNKERVLALTDGLSMMQVTVDNNTKMVVVGSPVNSFYDYQKIGIWQTSEADQAAQFGQLPGQIKIKDQNGDGQITPEDRVVVGSTVPKWSAGLNSEFKILKNIDVSLYFFTRIGQTINYQYTYDPNATQNSLSTRDFWTPGSSTNDLPRPGYSIPSQYLGTLRYVDGSFLKLRSATVGYTFPEKIAKKFGMSRMRVYATGKNLLVFSKIKNYDPEMAGNLTFPTVRLMIAGFNFDF